MEKIFCVFLWRVTICEWIQSMTHIGCLVFRVKFTVLVPRWEVCLLCLTVIVENSFTWLGICNIDSTHCRVGEPDWRCRISPSFLQSKLDIQEEIAIISCTSNISKISLSMSRMELVLCIHLNRCLSLFSDQNCNQLHLKTPETF